MKIELIARCVRGIEYAVADEITALMPGDLTLGAREVRFRVPRLDPAVCGLRTPDDIFLSVGSVEGVGHRKDVLPWLAEKVRQMDWRTAVEMVARVRELPPRVGSMWWRASSAAATTRGTTSRMRSARR